ncbi:adenine phosphoribosyltransferase [Actinomyces mediterranea]|uniref:adenine phosphoribosyltransferase n=1 Tax=Actinomyces mediterranea TaxID=1871028 RepID=UPI000971211E|nr:adenine phosphoribosyltransferase [Actinomyces mediterranea]
MSGELGADVAELVSENLGLIPDFPEPGVLFRDITPLIANGPVFKKLIEILAERYRGTVDAVAGLESRGFILGAPLATELGIGMLTIRKAGKLPGHVIGVDYALEYGTARMEIRPESVAPGSRILVIDDVLATGGTASASVELLSRCGAEVTAVSVLLELEGLNGRAVLADRGIKVESALLV